MGAGALLRPPCFHSARCARLMRLPAFTLPVRPRRARADRCRSARRAQDRWQPGGFPHAWGDDPPL